MYMDFLRIDCEHIICNFVGGKRKNVASFSHLKNVNFNKSQIFKKTFWRKAIKDNLTLEK